MTGITADGTTLMRQAHMTAGEYLDHGIRDIDQAFGDGYAREHPELLAAYMKTAALDLLTSTIAKEIGEAIEELGGDLRIGIETVAAAIEAKEP